MMNSQLQFAFFNLGPWEILLVLIVVLVLFGAKRLPELARGLGLGINEFRDAVDSSKKEIMDVIDSEKVDNKTSDSEEWFLLISSFYFSEQFYLMLVMVHMHSVIMELNDGKV